MAHALHPPIEQLHRIGVVFRYQYPCHNCFLPQSPEEIPSIFCYRTKFVKLFMHNMKKFARTISGVTPVAVMTSPMKCPGQCVYCPTYPATPQSYTTESPAVLRARICDYDAKAQVRLRLKTLSEMGHPTDKVEL